MSIRPRRVKRGRTRTRPVPGAARRCARGRRALRPRPAPPRRGRPGPAPPVGRHPGGALEEVEHRQAGGEARGAPGGQHVVGAGDVVAERFRAEAAEEDGAGVAHAGRTRVRDRAACSSRCSGARRLTSATASSQSRTTITAPCASQLAPAMAARGRVGSSAATAAATASAKAALVGDQDRLGGLVVLGLGQQIDRDLARIVGGVGQDHDLRRAGDRSRCRPGRTPGAWPRRHRRCRGRRCGRPGRWWRCRRPAPPPPARRRRGRSRPPRRAARRPAPAGSARRPASARTWRCAPRRRRAPGWRSSAPRTGRPPCRRARTARRRRARVQRIPSVSPAASVMRRSARHLGAVERLDPRRRQIERGGQLGRDGGDGGVDLGGADPQPRRHRGAAGRSARCSRAAPRRRGRARRRGSRPPPSSTLLRRFPRRRRAGRRRRRRSPAVSRCMSRPLRRGHVMRPWPAQRRAEAGDPGADRLRPRLQRGAVDDQPRR